VENKHKDGFQLLDNKRAKLFQFKDSALRLIRVQFAVKSNRYSNQANDGYDQLEVRKRLTLIESHLREYVPCDRANWMESS
jgi:hypothetical protein